VSPGTAVRATPHVHHLQYLYERRGLASHAAVLVGFYRPADATEKEGGGEGEDEGEMACTAEVSFDAMGAAHTHSAARVPLHVQHDCEEVDEEVVSDNAIGHKVSSLTYIVDSKLYVSLKVDGVV
jgi:hypothetical protein